MLFKWTLKSSARLARLLSSLLGAERQGWTNERKEKRLTGGIGDASSSTNSETLREQSVSMIHSGYLNQNPKGQGLIEGRILGVQSRR